MDFGFVYMDIMHVYPEDAGSYTIKATNALGQAVNSADLHVQSKEVIVRDYARSRYATNWSLGTTQLTNEPGKNSFG